MKNISNDNSGVSLIVAIIFVSVLMLLTANLAQVTITTIQNISNADFSQKTQYIAFGASDIAYQFSADNALGKNAEINGSSEPYDELNDYIDFLEKFSVSCADCVGFRVIGSGEKNPNGNYGLLKIGGTGSEYFSVPSAYIDENSVTVGTGNAAAKCENPDDADDPCHWNRIYVNDTVDVPLYYVDESGITQKLGENDKFKLRVRAPKCEDPMAPECANGRIELYPEVISNQVEYDAHPEYSYNDPKKDKVLIQWLISDLDTGETLFANDNLVKNKFGNNTRRPFPNNSKPELFAGNNTEISGGRINDANDDSLILKNFIVWEQDHKGMDLKKIDISINDFLKNLTKPTLRLNLIGQPRKQSDQSSVPYLEYQILADEPIADSKVTLFGWATISDFYKKFKVEKYLPKTGGGFVLGNL